MTILAVDTTNAACGVALCADGVLRYELSVRSERQHGAALVPMIETALATCGLTPQDISLWACAVGPGSFTGVRIGVSTIRGYAHALGAPCAAVNALEALALNQADGLAVPMFDARRGQVYAAAFCQGRRILPDSAMEAAAFLKLAEEAAESLGMPVVLLGDGARANAPSLTGENLRWAAPHLLGIRPGAVAALAREARPLPAGELLPYYLRPSQAEQARLARGEASPPHAVGEEGYR